MCGEAEVPWLWRSGASLAKGAGIFRRGPTYAPPPPAGRRRAKKNGLISGQGGYARARTHAPMNCSELDLALSDASVTLVETDGGFAVSCGALLVVSTLLLGMGERLLRPLSAVVAAVAAGVGVYGATALLEPRVDCVARLAIAGGGAVLAAVLALCVLKMGLFLLGAAGFGAVAHLIFDALPIDHATHQPFAVLGRPYYYYLTLLASAVVGAVVSQFQRHHFVRISTAMLGGSGYALATHLIYARATDGGRVSAAWLVAILVLGTGLGSAVQYTWAAHRRRVTVEDDV